MLLGQLLIDGVDDYTRNMLNKNEIFKAYKEIDSKMSSAEIIKQLRINTAISMFYSLPFCIQPCLLKGVLNVGAELINKGVSLNEVQDRIRYIEEYIDRKDFEEINETLKKYFQNVLYAPGPDF